MPRTLLVRCCLLVALFNATVAAHAAEFANAAQPRLAATNEGRVYVAYGHGRDVFVARSDNGGENFAPSIKVANVPQLMLGMRRGPRLAAQGEHVTVTLIAHDLLAFHSADGGRTWSGPVTLNEVPTSAREGLHDLAAGPDGKLFVTWLDLRSGKMELWGALSDDAGRTWGTNAPIYRSPDQAICECCQPTAMFNAAGHLAVMWRNSIAGARDMWLAVRPAGATVFAPARKLGTGTWTLNACPMDGGGLVPLGRGEFATVWQRAGEVFYCPADGAEISLGKGKQPVAIFHQGQPLLFWQQGPDLVSARLSGRTVPVTHAPGARFAVLASLANGGGTLLAYEQGPAKGASVVVERL